MLPFVLASTPTFSWNLMSDWQQIFRFSFMQYAFEAGTIIAIVAGVVGFFVVLRNLSFAGHALSHSSFAGATAAVVLGIGSLYGLLIFSLGGALIMGFLGKRLRGRDIAVGIVLAWTLGLGVFFLSLYAGYANEAYAILFGEILGISQSNVQTALVVGIITLAAVALIYRPLLFTSLDEEIAEARGIPTRLISMLFMIILALAVAGASMVVGVLLIFALLVTPAAIAERLSTRPPIVLLLSVVLSVIFTWVGLLIAYYFPYPVSFFITSLAFVTYLMVRFVPFAWTLLLAITNRKEDVEADRASSVLT